MQHYLLHNTGVHATLCTRKKDATFIYITLPPVEIFLQRLSIACYAEHCTSYSKSVHLSVTRWHCVNMTRATIMGSSLQDSPMTVVSSWLTSARNSKGNIASGAPNETGRKNTQFLANKSPYLRNGAR